MPLSNVQLTVPVFAFGDDPTPDDLWEAAKWLNETGEFKVSVQLATRLNDKHSLIIAYPNPSVAGPGTYTNLQAANKVLTRKGRLCSAEELVGEL